MIDWRRSYQSQWRVFRVNPDTWADSEEMRGVASMTVTRDTSELVEKASVTVDEPIGGDWREGYYRLSMVATQGGVSQRVDVATVLCTSSGGTIDRGIDSVSIDGKSVLYPASVTMVGEGWYAPKGADGVEYAASMLGSACNAPVTSDGSFTLGEHVVFSSNDSVLKSVRRILDAGGYTMLIDGRGVISIVPIPSEPAMDLDEAHASLLLPTVQHKLDYSAVKNRVTVRASGTVVTVVNDDPTSPTSYQSRGYWSDHREVSPTLTDGESPLAYARRRLEELSTVEDTRTYKREWWPDVYPMSVVRGTLPSVGLEGPMRIKSQKLTLKHGILVEEVAAREVMTWQR